jgi:hypothetical protein
MLADSAILRAKLDITDQSEKRSAIAQDLSTLSQTIFFLHPVGCGHRDDLAKWSCGCARGIALPVERLLLKTTPLLSGGF